MTHYIDPNSGAAPQPGGWAGPEGMKVGHALASDATEGVEQERQLNELPGEVSEEKSFDELVADAEQEQDEQEKSEEEQQLLQAQANPTQTLADLDEGDSASTVEQPEHTEEEASDAKALETEAVNLEEGEQGEDYDPSEHSVNEVNDYLEANPDKRDAVVKAERAGKARKGITGDE